MGSGSYRAPYLARSARSCRRQGASQSDLVVRQLELDEVVDEMHLPAGHFALWLPGDELTDASSDGLTVEVMY